MANQPDEEPVGVHDQDDKGSSTSGAFNTLQPTKSSHESPVVIISGAPFTPIISSSSSGPPAYQNSTPTGAPLCPSSSSSGPTEKKARKQVIVEQKKLETIHQRPNDFRQDEKKKKGNISAVKPSPTSAPTPYQAAAYPRDTTGNVVSLKSCASMRKEALTDNSASGSQADLNPAAESKVSTYEEKVQVTVPDTLNLEEHQKAQRKIPKLIDTISRLQKENTNQANTIGEQREELSNLRDRISQLEAEAALKAVVTSAARNEKAQREITRLRDQISEENTNHANTIRRKDEELSNLRDRISQLEAESAASNEAVMENWNEKFHTAAEKGDIEPLKLSLQNDADMDNQCFTKSEMDRTKMEMIVRNTLGDVLYDLLKQDKQNLKQRSHYDITILYKELNTLNKHIPSNGWGSTWKRIKKSDIAIGDDIERIRHIRNELQHSGEYVINIKRFRVLCRIINSLLKRSDDRIKHIIPRKLYTDEQNFYLAKTCS